MSTCLFCRIIAGELAATQVYSDEHCIAFRDIHPKARVHVLVVPRRHIVSLDQLAPEDSELMGHMLQTLAVVAREQGLTNGFRTQINTGREGGQEVDHLHFHVLGPV